MSQASDTPAPSPSRADGADLGRHLVVISGPSGAGKTTICRAVAERLALPISTSATTRPKRRGETDGQDYYFLTEQEFRARVDRGRFVEWAEVFGHLYGTPVEEVERARQSGNLLLLEIDIQGGIQIKRKYPGALAVLILSPDPEVLHERLAGRGTDSADEMQRRLAKAAEEVSTARQAGCYDVEVVNDRLEETVRHVVERIQARRNQA
ncbi:MAG: guanylate kinase [Planctomycetota bacterium]|nr:guanylate kinase [Planctomycetota bacterium]